jgi:hypothetical protein
LLQIDRGNPYALACPNEHIEPIMIDLARLGPTLAIGDGRSDEWAISVPLGSHIPRTIPQPDTAEASR